MIFISKRYCIKIPKEICLIYCKKKNVLLLKTQEKKRVLKLSLKLLILKEKKLIVVTNQLSGINYLNLKNNIKIVRGLVVSLIKKSLIEIKSINYNKLKLVGVGYKVFEEKNSNNQNFLHFKLGYSHSLYYKIPINLTIKTHQATKLFVFGYCKFNLSQCTSIIRKFKSPEPYKGKGVLFSDESIKLKEGKKV